MVRDATSSRNVRLRSTGTRGASIRWFWR
jgi:hypothetical protein